ncbi:MFS transporter [Shinella sp.]|uniref:MFS transporter n=1 Tax=Shinella sp. TaxID=1870904 RepID=UPI0029B8A71A|nr:MFS transporter [Shinella sp.]MDX3975438.1 MFS transporter [Shinella sp.]
MRLAKQVRLAAAFLLMMVSGLVWNSFALFLVALEGEFHWSRASISGAYGAFALINAVSAPLFGYLLGRYNSRVLLAGAAMLLGTAFLLTAHVSTIGQFWLAFGLVGGLGTHCTSSYAIFAVLAGRFRKRPATAMAIADAGSGLAAFLGLPVMSWMIEDLGWRFTYSALGIVLMGIAVPLHLFVIDRVKSASGTGGRYGLAGLGRVTILALVISYFCGSAAYHGLMTQQIALFEDNSVNAQTAVWIAAVAGLIIFVWRLLSGWLCDLWGSGPVMALAALAGVLTFGMLVAILVTANVAALLVYPLVLGVAFGGQQVLLADRARLVVTLSALSAVLGVCRLASGAGMAAGPVLAGSLHDWAGGYGAAIAVIAGLALLHFVTFAAIRRRQAPMM